MSRQDSHPSINRSPCDGCCHALRCRTQLLACRRFVAFQARGDIDTRLLQEPSRELFEKLFED